MDVPLEHLAATAQLLTDMLLAAAERSTADVRRPRLKLVGAHESRRAGEESLSVQARYYLRARRLRESIFPAGIFADPAWDMLLDLFACKLEGKRVCVSSACGAAGVPPTTALRWLDRLEACGLLERRQDPDDSRRIYVELTPLATSRMETWLNTAFHSAPEA